MPDDAAGMPVATDRGLLRFLTCGSVDDGKSTLIGRLLYNAELVLADQLEALERESRRFGTTGGDIDFSLLLDGLEDERQQRITIDAAYRFFATPRRAFIVADTPGHEQYTRNMVTGASTADLAVLLVDARKGVLTQTRRHSLVCSLLGIRHVVLAVNKLDLVGYSRDVFERIAEDYAGFAAGLGFASLMLVPLSAREGDNVTEPSTQMPWYEGPSLLDYLETIDVGELCSTQPDIAVNGWVLLQDDKATQPADNIAPLVRDDLLAKLADKAGFEKILNDVSAKMDTATLTNLNKSIAVDKKDIAAVATDWLKTNGFVK